MPKPKRPTPWCELDVCGQRYRVLLSEAEGCAELGDDEGVTLGERTEIYIQRGLSASRKEDTLIHELIHALLDASGAGHSLCEHLGLSEDRWREFEEKLARLMAPAMLATFRGAGWLEIPAQPKESLAPAARLAAKRGRK